MKKNSNYLSNRIPLAIKWEKIASFKNSIPYISKQFLDLENKKFVIVDEAYKIKRNDRKEYIVLFYADDKFSEKYYKGILTDNKKVNYLKEFYAISSLDFSTYPYIDDSYNIESIKKNRRFCTYCQNHDIFCIYNVVWTHNESYDIAFKNVEQGSIVSVSTFRIRNKDDENIFIKGYDEMKKIINPFKIIVYGKYLKSIENDFNSGLCIFVQPRIKLLNVNKYGLISLFE